MDDSYLTIAQESIAEIKVKGSRFIAETFLAESVDEATEKLQAVRKREHAATHHCYAYRTGLEPEVAFKYSDDGEPSGTAGKPIHDVVCGHDLTDILVVVTRYFGGTKLGTGGLVRAYSEAARLALEKSGTRENFLTELFRVKLDFKQYDQMVKTANRLDARVVNSDFSDVVIMEIEIRLSRSEEFKAAFTELTAGKGIIESIRGQTG